MRIWILNHYATDMYFDESGRHHAFAKYLIRMGHDVKIFCANTVHNSDVIVSLEGNKCIEKMGVDNVPYVFVKARSYQGNGKDRVLNMMDYFKNIKYVLNDYKKEEGIPDIILASSVHPLTLVAGIKWAHKNNIKCICEIRDLWPESIVEFTKLTKKNIVIQLLYKLEKWIYCNADALIFTMEGGEQYIKDKGWDIRIDLKKVYHVNNGVDLDVFNSNKEKNIYVNDFKDIENFTITYAGSIRPANGVMNLAVLAQKLKHRGIDNIDIFVFGDGSDKKKIEAFIKMNELNNICLFGKVDKKYIPSILSGERNINCLNYHYSDIFRYGGSQNKLFEYLASGRPIIANVRMGYDIIEKYNAGIVLKNDDLDALIEACEYLIQLKDEDYENLCENAKRAAYDYDYKTLTKQLLSIINTLN